MTVHVRQFDRAKALEIILFIAERLPHPTLHAISKILYLSDKLHLQDYGRLICGDRYIAMEYGPVPSTIYDMMKVADNRARVDVDWDEIIRDAFGVERGRTITPKRQADTHLIAESEQECLEATLAEYGQYSFGSLVDLTHDTAWENTEENRPIPLESIVRTLPNAQELMEHLGAAP